jgi:diguanylate cyclase (GGDEF)-like protein/PAS domain S-box-containing protein
MDIMKMANPKPNSSGEKTDERESEKDRAFINEKPTYEDLERRITLLEETVNKAKQIENMIHESREKFRVLVDSTPSAVMLYQDDRLISVNKAAEAITGYSVKELLAMNFWDIAHPNHKALVKEHGQKHQHGEETNNRYEIEIITKDGTVKWADVAGASAIIGSRPAGLISMADITERKRAEDKLKYLSIHDSLTGLHNRFFFEEELRRFDTGRFDPVGIVLCDLDGLKLVNDNLGHNIGDRQLIATANLLKEQFRSSDIVARIGGDEFAILLPDCPLETVRDICNQLKQAMMNIYIPDTKIPLMVSIGYAVHAARECLIEESLKEADARMYQEKAKNRQTFQEYFFHTITESLLKLRTNSKDSWKDTGSVQRCEPQVIVTTCLL